MPVMQNPHPAEFDDFSVRMSRFLCTESITVADRQDHVATQVMPRRRDHPWVDPAFLDGDQAAFVKLVEERRGECWLGP